MDKNNQVYDKDFEPLYQKIVETLVAAPGIKNELLELLRKGKLHSQNIFVLMLKLDELLKANMQTEMSELEEKARQIAKKVGTPRFLPKVKEQYIDGNKLTPSEIAYEEYSQGRFDEEKWLQDVGIQYP